MGKGNRLIKKWNRIIQAIVESVGSIELRLWTIIIKFQRVRNVA